MAGMKFTADVNVKDIIKLRQEIDRLKNLLLRLQVFQIVMLL